MIRALRIKTLLLACLVIAALHTYSQGWVKKYSPDSQMGITSLYVTADGNYITTGWNLTGYTQRIMKIGVNGSPMWVAGNDSFTGISFSNITQDGGFISLQYDMPGNRVLFRTNAAGQPVWQRQVYPHIPNIGGIGNADIDTTDDGGFVYAISGFDSASGMIRMFVARTDANGDTLWCRTYFDGDSTQYVSSLRNTKDGGFTMMVTHGVTPQTAGNSFCKIDGNGNMLWSVAYPYATQTMAADGNILLCGRNSVTNANFIAKLNQLGNHLWNLDYPAIPDTTYWYSRVVENDDHTLAVIGYKSDGLNNGYSLCIVDTLGNLLLHKSLPSSNLGYGVRMFQATYKTFIKAADGGYILGGWLQEDPNDYSAVLIKMDSAGNVYPNLLSGNIFYDDNENCQQDANEPFVNPVIITFQNATDTFITASGDSGYYALALDTGNYNVAVTPPSPYWEASNCNTHLVNLPAGTDSSISFGLKPLVYSPYVTISGNISRMRSCMPSIYTAKYCNTGTAPFTGIVEVEIDTLFHVDSTSIPFTAQNGNKYFFTVPALGIMECATLHIYGTISCVPGLMGHTLCVDAHAYQDTVVNASPLWDESDLQLMVVHNTVTDTITFTLKNNGNGGMGSPKGLMVIEDNVILMNIPVQLTAGGEFVKQVPANGSTWRATIEQTLFNPYSAFTTAAIEGAGTNQQGAISLGYYLQYPINGYYGFHYNACGEITNSYDPNEKVVMPKGVGPDKLVDSTTELEYTLYFQNTGNDTAYLIRLTDTLVDYLNPATLVAGASSHPYQMELNNKALQFTFYNINLPDSGANQLGSNGFVKFRIKQKSGNAQGTVINNKVAIYFDYNPPVVTNTATVRIGYVLMTDVQILTKDYEVSVKAYPNPFVQSARIEVKGANFNKLQFNLYDISGRLVKQQTAINTNSFTVDKTGLTNGAYFFEITENGKAIAKGKLLAQ